MREITPEQLIANVRVWLAYLRSLPRHQGKEQAVPAAEAHLAELEREHAAGRLRPLPDDNLPF